MEFNENGNALNINSDLHGVGNNSDFGDDHDFDLGEGQNNVQYGMNNKDETEMNSYVEDLFVADDETMEKQLQFYDPPYVQTRDDIASDTTKLQKARWRIKIITESLHMRLCGIVLVFIDITLVICDLAWDPKPSSAQKFFEVTSLLVMMYFIVEVSLRIFANGKTFFITWYMVLDLCVTTVCALVTIAYIVFEELQEHKYGKLVAAIRFIRVLFFVRFLVERYQQKKQKRHFVESSKGGYEDHMYEIDLTIITEGVMVMSFPSSYGRYNPIVEVADTLNTRYPGSYRVYNLCSEGGYDESYFNLKVQRVNIEDQNVPALSDVMSFCKDVQYWLSLSEDNVVVAHCKGGKGRTGMMLSAFLVHCDMYEQAKGSLLNFIGNATQNRCMKYPAVETPSQSRYVEYIKEMKSQYEGELPPSKELKLASIQLKAMSGIGKGDGRDLRFEILSNKLRIYECRLGSKVNCQTTFDYDTGSVLTKILNSPVLSGDVKIVCYSSTKSVPTGYGDSAFYVCFHTGFIEDNTLHLQRSELDNLHKEKAWKVFKEEFAVTFKFRDLHESIA